MSPEEYIVSIKERFGDQSTKDGHFIRDLEDSDLLKRMLARYPGDRDKIIGIDDYLAPDEQPPTLPPTEVESQFEKFTGGVARAFAERNKKVAEAKASGDLSMPEGIAYGAGQVAGLVGDVGLEFIKSILKPEVKDKIKGGIEAITSTDIVQGAAAKYKEFADANPRAAKDLESVVNLATIIPGIGYTGKGLLKGAEAGAKAAEKVAAATPKIAVPSVTGIKDTLKGAKKTVEGVYEKGVLPQGVKEKLAQSDIPGVGPGLGDQVKTSSQRLANEAPLMGAGAAIRPKPIKVYDEFVSQGEKHLKDAKIDPPISKVGERIGDAFEEVVKKRQAAGARMSESIKGLGKTKVNTSGARKSFIDELNANGLDVADDELVAIGATKFTSGDRKLLNWYRNELDKLGDTPTVGQLDAFASRIPNEADELLNKTIPTNRTNAERIINQNLRELKKSFDNFPEYKAARDEYAELSKFLEEGYRFLGKKTQSGDYAKDASIAKSAVQSVLNNGKKDWLIKLEELTGYNSIDEATLALQAMKDLGDFKGNSLLELLTTGNEITRPGVGGLSEVLIRMAQSAAGKAGQVLKGSKVEQTRNYLKSIKNDE